jgi:hypothetical protein
MLLRGVTHVIGTLLLSPFQRFIESIHKGTFSGGFVDFLGHWASDVPDAILRFSPTVFGIGIHLWFLGFSKLSSPQRWVRALRHHNAECRRARLRAPSR